MRFKVKKNDNFKHSEICTAVAWAVNNDVYRYIKLIYKLNLLFIYSNFYKNKKLFLLAKYFTQFFINI